MRPVGGATWLASRHAGGTAAWGGLPPAWRSGVGGASPGKPRQPALPPVSGGRLGYRCARRCSWPSGPRLRRVAPLWGPAGRPHRLSSRLMPSVMLTSPVRNTAPRPSPPQRYKICRYHSALPGLALAGRSVRQAGACRHMYARVRLPQLALVVAAVHASLSPPGSSTCPAPLPTPSPGGVSNAPPSRTCRSLTATSGSRPAAPAAWAATACSLPQPARMIQAGLGGGGNSADHC